jgi:tRNA(adenine34) deaminase
MDHARYLDITLEEAELGQREGAVPVGSVVVAPDGTILSRGRNRVLSEGDQTAHAEVDAIRNAGAAIATPPGDGGWLLYTSAEPCLMCLGAILLCPIQTVIWAAASQQGSAYEAALASGYRPELLQALQVVKEPSPEHKARSREILDAFARRG